MQCSIYFLLLCFMSISVKTHSIKNFYASFWQKRWVSGESAYRACLRTCGWICGTHANLDAGGKFCNPSTPKVRWEVERRESQEAHCPRSLAYAAGDNERAYLKQCRSRGWTLEITLWSVHIYSGTLVTGLHTHEQHQHTRDLLCVAVNLV